MKRIQRTSMKLLVLLTVLSAGSQAAAQFGGGRIDRPIDTPTFSPYLNMLRDSSSGPGMNYFGLVRPQQEFAQQNQQLGQGLQMLQMQQMQGMQMMPGARMYGYSQLGTTGHPVMFNSFGTSHFTGGYSGMVGSGVGGGVVGGNMGGGFGGGMAGGGFNGGMNQGFSQFGGTSGAGGFGMQAGGFGGVGTGFSGVSGHPSSFGNIVQPGVGMSRGR